MQTSEHHDPSEDEISEEVLGLARTFHLQSLERRYNSRLVLSGYAMIFGFISVGVMTLASLLTAQPLVFPSLGATACILFAAPHGPAASPKHTICGHLIGAICGFLALVAFGLQDEGPAMLVGMTGPRVAAAALSLGLTAGLMVWFSVIHPPAGATALIVSLGLIVAPLEIAVLMLAVVFLVAQGFFFNRLAGMHDYPLWAPKTDP